MSTDPIVIGIAGGTGSGKTTVARRILDRVPAPNIVLIGQDSYYRDLGHLPPEERKKTNFDHPDALDNDLLIEQLDSLRGGTAVEQPIYDYKTNSRVAGETRRLEPARILVVEGILVLVDPRLRERMDIKLFVDCAPDVRFIRRLQRDVVERGRTLESVVNQYLSVVREMHLRFVEPSKRYADVIIPEGGHNTIAIDMVATKITSILGA